MASAAGEVQEDASHLAITGHLPQANILNVRERDHHGKAVVRKAEEVKTLGLGSKRAEADIFNSRYPVVRVNDLLTNLKGHAGTQLHPQEVVANLAEATETEC
jgi:hypothetical protein